MFWGHIEISIVCYPVVEKPDVEAEEEMEEYLDFFRQWEIKKKDAMMKIT